MSGRVIRAEDGHFVYVAIYDTYYKDVVISLTIIHKNSAQIQQTTMGHYYSLGVLVGKDEFKVTREGDI
jgi:hypothetical protein